MAGFVGKPGIRGLETGKTGNHPGVRVHSGNACAASVVCAPWGTGKSENPWKPGMPGTVESARYRDTVVHRGAWSFGKPGIGNTMENRDTMGTVPSETGTYHENRGTIGNRENLGHETDRTHRNRENPARVTPRGANRLRERPRLREIRPCPPDWGRSYSSSSSSSDSKSVCTTSISFSSRSSSSTGTNSSISSPSSSVSTTFMM